jgi:hypothetical protein
MKERYRDSNPWSLLDVHQHGDSVAERAGFELLVPLGGGGDARTRPSLATTLATEAPGG